MEHEITKCDFTFSYFKLLLLSGSIDLNLQKLFRLNYVTRTIIMICRKVCSVYVPGVAKLLRMANRKTQKTFTSKHLKIIFNVLIKYEVFDVIFNVIIV